MHVVITGASSGIGEGLVREYVAAGASVTMVARRTDRMEAIAKDVGGTTHIISKDLSDPETAADWLDAAEEAMGLIDVFVNNAGVQIVGPLVDADPADGDWLLAVDLNSPLRLVRAILPRMLERNKGTIVNVASLAALAPTPGMFYYSAAKAGFAAASESLHGELRGTGVNVLTVYPGPVTTDMANKAFEAYGDQAPPKVLPEGNTTTLARRIRRAVRSRRKRLIYPRWYVVARHFPGLTRWVMDHFAPIPPGQS
ncbi:MAG: SDR family NAD(P)-dependent oxidoreductase [Deltaproteobacteria bacterium]|nr:MAG: SDR family NAD(P)-dependent oxidoreductase [Deltaproteobacteria bacterium]